MQLFKNDKLYSPERSTSSIDIPSALTRALPTKLITKIKSISCINSPTHLRGNSLQTLNNNQLMYNSNDIGKNQNVCSQPAIPEFDLSKFKYLKSIPVDKNESDNERKEMQKLNPVYYKTNKIDIIPKISTSKFRRRFGVNLDKLRIKNMKMDSEHLNLQYKILINEKESMASIAKEFNFDETETISQIETKQFNDISSIVGDRLNNFNEEIKEEECSCSSTIFEITIELNTPIFNMALLLTFA